MTSEALAAGTGEISAALDDLYVLDSEGVAAFVIDLNSLDAPPPFYIDVKGPFLRQGGSAWVRYRGSVRFAFTSETFLLQGHGAVLPDYVRAEEAEGRLVLFGERDDRLLIYGFDPNAEDEDDREEGDAE